VLLGNPFFAALEVLQTIGALDFLKVFPVAGQLLVQVVKRRLFVFKSWIGNFLGFYLDVVFLMDGLLETPVFTLVRDLRGLGYLRFFIYEILKVKAFMTCIVIFYLECV
jgi:hypothetical protein